ncbi:MAG TPA: TetR/AcrR family transcriptional regulator [Rectinemataceae bacterium]|nr:TetR/AcrR family transcriptional regulator [Rectinemataceae bacterium]
MGQQGSDTRDRIEEIAIKLFTEKGYDRTSLREIAEGLGVTKAALYYHFKSKEEILQSIVDGRRKDFQDVIDWGVRLPRTPEARREILERIAGLVETKWKPMIRFAQVNQVRMGSLKGQSGEANLEQMRQLFMLVCGPDAAPAEQFKSALAIIALLVGAAGMGSLFPSLRDTDFSKIALQVATELIGS